MTASDREVGQLAAACLLRREPSGARLTLQRSAYSTSAPVDELTVRLADGSTHQLIRKDLHPDFALPQARGIRPPFLHDPMREVVVYRDVLPADLDAPAYLGSVVDPTMNRYWLLLERVSGLLLWQEGDFATWIQVARWLSRFHASALSEAMPPAARAHLLAYDRAFYERWLALANAALPGAARAAIRPVFAAHAALVDWLVSLPLTFIHGEFFPSNVIVSGEGAAARVAVIDWETAGMGTGLLDLAALVEGWPQPERLALVRAYREEVGDHGNEERFLADLDACRLHLCIRWLGWARDWRPPAEHERDWVGLALELARGLDVT